MVGTSVHPDLLIGHPINDAVISWVHVPQVVGYDDDGEDQSDHQPQHDVEDHGVLKVVLVGQVVRAARVTLKKKIYNSQNKRMTTKIILQSKPN